MKGSNPKSLDDDAQGGDHYIHLPSQQCLRKVRETMYGDLSKLIHFVSKTLRSRCCLLQHMYHTHTATLITANNGSSTMPQATQTSKTKKQDKLSVPSDPFNLTNTRAPSERETWTSLGPSRRLMSVNIGTLPTSKTLDPYNPSDDEPSWPNIMPTMHVQHPGGALFTTDAKRNTRFYDFYDDLLAEYGIGESGGVTYSTQFMLSIKL
jgi:hypothetical protein